MTVELSPAARRWLDESLARGKYSSEAEVVECALELLARQDAGDDDDLADIRAGIADMEAGRTYPLEEVMESLYREFPNLKP